MPISPIMDQFTSKCLMQNGGFAILEAIHDGLGLFLCLVQLCKQAFDAVNNALLLRKRCKRTYDDIRNKLEAMGVPREEIAFIHEATTGTQKAELFAKVRAGQVRVLLGSTAKLGAGTNMQDRLIALHHLDAPWKPSEEEQTLRYIIFRLDFNCSQSADIHSATTNKPPEPKLRGLIFL